MMQYMRMEMHNDQAQPGPAQQQQQQQQQEVEPLQGLAGGDTSRTPATGGALRSSRRQQEKHRRIPEQQPDSEGVEQLHPEPSAPPTRKAVAHGTTNSRSLLRLAALKQQLASHLATYATTGQPAPDQPLLPGTIGRSYLHHRLYTGPAAAVWWGNLNPLEALLEKHAYQHLCWLPLCIEEALGWERDSPSHAVTLVAMLPQGPPKGGSTRTQTTDPSSAHTTSSTARPAAARATPGATHASSSSNKADKVATTIPGVWREAARLEVQAVLSKPLGRGTNPGTRYGLPRQQLQQELGHLGPHYLQALMVDKEGQLRLYLVPHTLVTAPFLPTTTQRPTAPLPPELGHSRRSSSSSAARRSTGADSVRAPATPAPTPRQLCLMQEYYDSTPGHPFMLDMFGIMPGCPTFTPITSSGSLPKELQWSPAHQQQQQQQQNLLPHDTHMTQPSSTLTAAWAAGDTEEELQWGAKGPRTPARGARGVAPIQSPAGVAPKEVAPLALGSPVVSCPRTPFTADTAAAVTAAAGAESTYNQTIHSALQLLSSAPPGTDTPAAAAGVPGWAAFISPTSPPRSPVPAAAAAAGVALAGGPVTETSRSPSAAALAAALLAGGPTPLRLLLMSQPWGAPAAPPGALAAASGLLALSGDGAGGVEQQPVGGQGTTAPDVEDISQQQQQQQQQQPPPPPAGVWVTPAPDVGDSELTETDEELAVNATPAAAAEAAAGGGGDASSAGTEAAGSAATRGEAPADTAGFDQADKDGAAAASFAAEEVHTPAAPEGTGAPPPPPAAAAAAGGNDGSEAEEALHGLRRSVRQQGKEDVSSSVLAAPPLSAATYHHHQQQQQQQPSIVGTPPAWLHDLLQGLPSLSMALDTPGLGQQLLCALHQHLQAGPFLVTPGSPWELWWWPCLTIADLDLPQGNGLFLCPASHAPAGFVVDRLKHVTVKLLGLSAAGVDPGQGSSAPTAAAGQVAVPGSWQQLVSFQALLSYRYRASCDPWLALGPRKCLAALQACRGWHLLHAELVVGDVGQQVLLLHALPPAGPPAATPGSMQQQQQQQQQHRHTPTMTINRHRLQQQQRHQQREEEEEGGKGDEEWWQQQQQQQQQQEEEEEDKGDEERGQQQQPPALVHTSSPHSSEAPPVVPGTTPSTAQALHPPHHHGALPQEAAQQGSTHHPLPTPVLPTRWPPFRAARTPLPRVGQEVERGVPVTGPAWPLRPQEGEVEQQPAGAREASPPSPKEEGGQQPEHAQQQQPPAQQVDVQLPSQQPRPHNKRKAEEQGGSCGPELHGEPSGVQVDSAAGMAHSPPVPAKRTCHHGKEAR